jgi:hypothetical protein
MDDRAHQGAWDRQGVLQAILDPVPLPRMAAIRQHFADKAIKDIPAVVAKEMARPGIAASVRPGMSIAITAGSRGIANIPLILREIISALRAWGARPFVFPAMGSHGGATEEGQRLLLEGYGITERSVGAPIRATMETRIIGTTEQGYPVHMDRFAVEADGIIVVGRVKPHTAFHGSYESGLMKMMAIGMGKQKGAETCHAAGFGKFAHIVPSFGRTVLANAKVLFGVGIVENSLDETYRIEAIPSAAIESREPELLAEARRLMPTIPFSEFDVLVVDTIGKNFSGDGADPNVTGTYCTPYASGGPRIQRYVVLDVSEESHGNSLGVGMADITTARLLGKTDYDAMYSNAVTNRVLNNIRIPLVMKNDRLALQAAVFTCIDIDIQRPRIVRISNTSHVGTLTISEALLEEARANPAVEVLGSPGDLVFDNEGNLF